VAPRGMEEGSSQTTGEREFALAVGEPAEFRFFTSTHRRDDGVGTLLDELPDDLTEVAPLSTTLDGEPGAKVPVTIQSNVTEIGTLELWCVARDGRRWRLEYNVREPTSEMVE